MNEFIVTGNKSKAARILAIVSGGYFTVFCLYFLIMELMATPSRFELLFFASLIGALLGITLLLRGILSRSGALVTIDSNTINVHLPKRDPVIIEWVNVSEATFGVSYVVFLLNGQKEQRIDLSHLVYTDMRNTKNKIIELCEHKNIPYKND